jgi:hypothetical protein
VRSLRSPSILCAAALATVLLSACAGTTGASGNLTGDSKAIAQTISNLQADTQSRNNSHLCSNDLAPAVVARLNSGSRTCTSVISKQLGEAEDYAISLASGHAIAVSGTTATARVTDTVSGNKKHVDVLHLVRDGKVWKLASSGAGT